ncbi:hypothetical protein TRVL_07248 [Trypanosoma vivax]|nr:hypothetical protein TRVL_07248 [Trypanosoma vivax]
MKRKATLCITDTRRDEIFCSSKRTLCSRLHPPTQKRYFLPGVSPHALLPLTLPNPIGGGLRKGFPHAHSWGTTAFLAFETGCRPCLFQEFFNKKASLSLTPDPLSHSFSLRKGRRKSPGRALGHIVRHCIRRCEETSRHKSQKGNEGKTIIIIMRPLCPHKEDRGSPGRGQEVQFDVRYEIPESVRFGSLDWHFLKPHGPGRLSRQAVVRFTLWRTMRRSEPQDGRVPFIKKLRCYRC